MIQRGIAILLLFVFSFSISVFSAELHYCKGEITDISFFGDATCACPSMDKMSTHCQMHKKKKSCCETTVISHEAAEDFKEHSDVLVNSVEITAILVQLFAPYLFIEEAGDVHVYEDYTPPNFRQDRQVLYQSFLI